MSEKRRKSWWILSLTGLALTVLVFSGAAGAQDQWPREIGTAEGKLVVYTPQVESFKGDKVTARAAIAIQKKNAKEPVFGVAWFSARGLTDRGRRVVDLTEVKIDRVKFPHSTPGQEKELMGILERDADKWTRTSMSLDRLLAQVAAAEREKRVGDDKISTDPPKVLFSSVPSVLIVINGKPQMRKVENSDLERVINTPFIILYEPSGKTWYLKGGDFWYAAAELPGPWKTVDRPPVSVTEAAGRLGERVDPSETANQPKPKTPPWVIVATEPTELIVSEGDPQYESIQGTELLYMSNTPAEVLMEVKTQQYYVLLAGRWYRGPSLEKGPFTYVAPEKLPGDFMRIPPGSAKGHLLAFVGGTTQAEEAVLDAQIPQTMAVKRNEAKLSVAYDGDPKFEKIKGTGMEYAANTGTQVVKAGGRYYAVDKAVWFVSDSPRGPWAVADAIPREIEEIPPESPVYNVKYVRVYDSTPEVVYVGYTPGYLGTYVYGGSIVYGTGYLYPAWAGTVYYPGPFTWGFAPIYDPFYCSWGFGWGLGAGFVSGFGWGFTVGAGYSPWWYGWGGWGWGGWGWGWGWHHAHPYPYYGGWGHSYPGSHGYIHRPINVDRPHHDSRPTGFGRGAGSRPGGGRDGTNWRGNRPNQGPGGREMRPGQGPAGRETRPGTGSGSSRDRGVSRPNDVYAGHDGNVYRRSDRGWEMRDRSGWARPGTRQGQSFERTRPGLERDFSARQRGFERSRDFGRAGGYGVPGRGGAGGGAYGGPRSGGPGGGGNPRGGGGGARENRVPGR